MKRTTLISPRKTAVFVHVAVVATGHVVGQIIVTDTINTFNYLL